MRPLIAISQRITESVLTLICKKAVTLEDDYNSRRLATRRVCTEILSIVRMVKREKIVEQFVACTSRTGYYMHLKESGLFCIRGKNSNLLPNGASGDKREGEARARSVGALYRGGYESNSSEVAAVEWSGAADSIMIIPRMKFTANHHAHTQ